MFEELDLKIGDKLQKPSHPDYNSKASYCGSLRSTWCNC